VNVNIVDKVIKDISGLEADSREVLITFIDGSVLKQFHYQDCCEDVWISQVDNDVSRHIGATVIGFEEKVVYQPEDIDYYESCTATFYTLKTSKGYLDWRWQGESNGYYSESVDMTLSEATKTYI
jgi:hypothetical protein